MAGSASKHHRMAPTGCQAARQDGPLLLRGSASADGELDALSCHPEPVRLRSGQAPSRDLAADSTRATASRGAHRSEIPRLRFAPLPMASHCILLLAALARSSTKLLTPPRHCGTLLFVRSDPRPARGQEALGMVLLGLAVLVSLGLDRTPAAKEQET